LKTKRAQELELSNDIWGSSFNLTLSKKASDFVMGLGQFFCCLCWVGSGQPSLVWVWKISPQKSKMLQFFSLQVKKYPDQRRVGPLFTDG